MASTYSTNLKIELIPTGAQSGIWGATTNTNLGTALEQAIVGLAACPTGDFTANEATYTLADTNTSQTARAFVLNVTATLTAAGTINVPAVQKPYLVFNNSVGGFAVTVKVSGQTGVSIPNGKRAWLYNNGTDVGVAFDYAPSLVLGTPLLPASGGTGIASLGTGVATWLGTPSSANLAAAVTDETGTGALVFANTPTLVTPILGTPTSGTLTNATGLPLTTGVTGTLPTGNGGTGVNSYTAGDITYYAAGTALTKLPIGTVDYVLTSTGSAPQWSPPSSVVIGTANNLAGGTTGAVPYQSGVGATTFLSLGTTNYVMTAGATGPQYVAQSTLSVGTAINLAGGTANQIVYQTGAGATGFVTTPSTANYVLTWTGSAFTWASVPSVTSAGNLLGGAAGDLVYQSATDVSAFLPDVATGNALITGGVGVAPSYGKIGLTTHVSGTLPVANGGTNITSYTIGDIVYASASTTLASLADIATGNALISGGVGASPSYGKIGLTTHVSGTLPVSNGGTNITSYTIGDIVYASASTTLASLADVATGNALITGGVGVAPSYGKIGLTTHVSGTLPVANGGTGQTTYTDGQLLIGNSTGNTLTKATLTQGTGVTISNTAGAITISATGTGGTVTSVAQTFTGGLISVAGSPVTTTGTLALTVAGTSGGIPYFSSASTWASSAALTQYGVVYGGGAGATPVATAAGTTGQVLTATTGGAPTWASASGGAQAFITMYTGSNQPPGTFNNSDSFALI